MATAKFAPIIYGMRIVAARAEHLRQGAVKLDGTADIVREFKSIEEASRKPVEADKEQVKVKGLADKLSVLEREINTREVKEKKEQERMDRAMVSAIGDFADDLTRTL